MCPPGFSKCANNKKCISDDWRCDVVDDCGDGSDEVDCNFNNQISEFLSLGVLPDMLDFGPKVGQIGHKWDKSGTFLESDLSTFWLYLICLNITQSNICVSLTKASDTVRYTHMTGNSFFFVLRKQKPRMKTHVNSHRPCADINGMYSISQRYLAVISKRNRKRKNLMVRTGTEQ